MKIKSKFCNYLPRLMLKSCPDSQQNQHLIYLLNNCITMDSHKRFPFVDSMRIAMRLFRGMEFGQFGSDWDKQTNQECL